MFAIDIFILKLYSKRILQIAWFPRKWWKLFLVPQKAINQFLAIFSKTKHFSYLLFPTPVVDCLVNEVQWSFFWKCRWQRRQKNIIILYSNEKTSGEVPQKRVEQVFDKIDRLKTVLYSVWRNLVASIPALSSSLTLIIRLSFTNCYTQEEQDPIHPPCHLTEHYSNKTGMVQDPTAHDRLRDMLRDLFQIRPNRS